MLYKLPNYFSFICAFTSLLISCKKKEINDQPTNLYYYTSAHFSLVIKSNNNELVWDSINNVNSSNNKYDINKINLFISNFCLKRTDGYIYKSNKIIYLDPKVITKNNFHFDSIPSGNYIQLTFYVGLDTSKNKDYILDPTIDNLNMAWPVAMGGGYHFFKMEGHFIDNNSVIQGYAIHLGKNENLPFITINKNISQNKNPNNYTLLFNTNEVFDNPYKYDLNIDNNYTMSDSVAMRKIKLNLYDAFTIIQNN